MSSASCPVCGVDHGPDIQQRDAPGVQMGVEVVGNLLYTEAGEPVTVGSHFACQGCN